jgi:WhiB family redox-sensing transcriptional regulator
MTVVRKRLRFGTVKATKVVSTRNTPHKNTGFKFLESEIPNDASTPCRENDPELWFSVAPEDVEEAKAWCYRCPFMAPCGAEAESRREYAGVWGGEYRKNRRVEPTPQPTGRPPLDRS